jgi:hypothetical protein
MNGFRADRAEEDWDEEDDEGAAPPLWKRPRLLLAGAGVAVLLAFLFTRGKPQHAQDAPKAAQSYIGVVVPYQPAKAEDPPTPPPTTKAAAPAAAPAEIPAPPPIPAFRGVPAAARTPARPAMLQGGAQRSPEARHSSPGGSAADRARICGVAAAGDKGVAGDRRHL